MLLVVHEQPRAILVDNVLLEFLRDRDALARIDFGSQPIEELIHLCVVGVVVQPLAPEMDLPLVRGVEP